MIFKLNKILAIAAIPLLSASGTLLYRVLIPETSVAIAETLTTPPPGLDHNTLITMAEQAAKGGRYDEAIINYRRAKRIASTGCAIGLAAAGEIASLEAKEWMATLRLAAPGDASENADMAYRRRFRQAQKSITAGMFCGQRRL
jgi:hypothetical protein